MSNLNFIRIIYLIGVCFTFASSFTYAQCDDYEKDLPSLHKAILSLSASSSYIEQLLQGKLQHRDVTKGQRFASLFKLPLGEAQKTAPVVQLLQTQLDSLRRPLSMTDELSLCAEQGALWLDLSNERRQAEFELLKQKILFLQLPASQRAVLARQVLMWEQLKAVDVSIKLNQKQFIDNETILVELDRLNVWVTHYQASFDSWLMLYRRHENDFSRIDQHWLTALSLPSPNSKVLDKAALVFQIPDALDWLDVMNESRSVLFKDMSKWRNQALLNKGWLAFLSQLTSPSIFLEGLFYELVSAPNNVLDNLTRPFIKAFRLAIQQDKEFTLILGLFSQVLALAFLSFVLIKIAGGATSWLASVQRGLIVKLKAASLRTFMSGVFWVLKPNASWIFILVAANSIVLGVHKDWRILALIGPLGTTYAIFRGFRVIIEWALSRTYMRSDMFLSSHAAEALVFDSRKIAWITLICVLFWWLAFATGGGYSIFLVSLINFITLWLACLWLLSKYKQAVDKFIGRVLGKQIRGESTQFGVVLSLLLKFAWPLTFLFAHAIDVLFSLHQKMMIFDVYRSLSVKMLRVRLESRSDESVEEEEKEPDQNYTDWMLRNVTEDDLFDVGDISSAIEPLDKWLSDRTDENITVVVGESGSGKSTFIRRLPNIWDKTPIKVLDVPAKLTDAQRFYDQITALLGIEPITDAGGLVKQDESIEQQVVVIDSAHNLFMAEVGYFNAYRALMDCMNAHLDNVYWVVVFNAPSWTYLNYVFSREQRVSNVFKMPRWSPMDIRKLILSRHKGARRRLKYNNMLLSAAASSESSSIRAADSRVFNILWEQSGGNPLAAIELWLDAVNVKGRLAEVGVPERPSANLLNGMKDDLYFIYTAIVLHASLSTAEIMRVTHFSEPVVRHAVKQGVNMGMIIRDESKRYKIDPYWYGSLSGFLHRKNLLWS